MELWKRLGILVLCCSVVMLAWISIKVFSTPSNFKQQVQIKDVTKSQSLTLFASETKELIHRLDLKIEGQIDGAANFNLSFSDTTIYKTYRVSKGTATVEYSGDWYFEYFHLEYLPETVSSGSLSVNFTFY